jgi:hypothetical protein
MKKQIFNHLMGIAGLLVMGAAPALPSTVLSFTFQPSSGSYSGTTQANTTGTFYLEQLTESVNGVATVYLPGTTSFANLTNMIEVLFNNATQSMTMTAEATGTNFQVPVGTSLYSATTTLSDTGTPGGSGTLTETVTGVTHGVNATFLSELGLAANSNFDISGTITGSNGTIGSETLNLTLAPEPASLFMFGAGLLLVAFVIRKRRLAASQQTVAIQN